MVRAVLIALVAALAASATPAAAAKPCWQRLIDDYADGRIDGTYPVPCYGAAIAHLPEDVRVYSSAEDDIDRALLTATSRRRTLAKAPARAAAAPTRRTAVVSPTSPPKQRKRVPASPTPTPLADVERGTPVLRAAPDSDGDAGLPLPVLVSAIGGALLVGAAGTSAAARRLRR